MTEDDRTLWRALQPLRSTATFLMTGAHPDDEWSGFLAWLAFGCGVRTVYACSTRGDGGQNALGPERGRALGALRSREMERAAEVLDLRLHWIGAGPGNGEDDPIHDFGFSKSGEDTLARWGEALLLDRLVRLIRAEQPDAVSPTFLDVPGQHGHHRAMTRSTLRAAGLAADPAYATGQPPWQVAKVYLPAFSGAGGSYDDREPPPPETVRVDLGEVCATLGLSWAQLGEESRRWHASQGMGRDLPPGPRPFALHLARGAADVGLPMDGLISGLAALGEHLADGPQARALREAGAAVDAALAAFPVRPAVADALHVALAALSGLELPESASHIAARVAIKRRQLGRAAALALGIGARLETSPAPLRGGGRAALRIAQHGAAEATLRLPEGWSSAPDEGGAVLHVPGEAAPFGTERDGFDPLGGGDALGLRLEWRHGGSSGVLEVDPPAPLALAPAVEVRVTPERLVRRSASSTPAVLALEGAPAPASWPVHAACGTALTLRLSAGRRVLLPAGARLARFPCGHVGLVARVEPACAMLLRADIAVDPAARVGVVAGEADETLGWLRQIDIAAEAVDDAMLEAGDLSQFTTILVGVFGFGQRPALLANRARLLAWAEAGGSLVTLYHRPGDGWQGGATPPHRLVVGSPSFRWRVTDPAAPVRVLAPAHPLLCWPNPIGPADWQGWVRERGLYFASDWDPAYTPLLELADAGETPLRGALLAAPVGQGRHVHVALALHHQLSALVPGGFRLLANLVARVGLP
jgi:LmbE family N-acetylglucosaminyl deacetylase